MRVNVVCRNPRDDRVLPRFARYLAENNGWTLTASPDLTTEVIYLMGYFEVQTYSKWPVSAPPVVCYFTHREEEPQKNNEKAKLYDQVAGQVALRVAMCKLYAGPLSKYGPTVQPPLPLERERFILAETQKHRRPVVGFSGYTYKNHRKGEDLVNGVIKSPIGNRVDWVASGRGWPVSIPAQRYSWADMPKFYQGLDILVCPSHVEGGPMPVLEALACGVRVVIPRGVGILDELKDAPGIHRYKRGDLPGMIAALESAISQPFDRDALRAVTAPYTVKAFCDANAQAIEQTFNGIDAGIDESQTAPQTQEAEVRRIDVTPPVEHKTGSTRGIYCVAFGEPARRCAVRMMTSAKKHMPDIPIALCSSKSLGIEDVTIIQPDSDVGGRRAKLRAYELAPAEWQSILYLDADTEITAPVYQFFQWIEDGWELVICRDVGETLHSFQRKNNLLELRQLETQVGTLYALQFNGGVWSFGRCDATKSFMERWRKEWEIHAQRDQGALIRALYAAPLKIYVLENEWNCFTKYTPNTVCAGVMHYPGDARRWEGKLPGRIDAASAWARVTKR